MLNDDALTATEVAAILHMGRNAVYELARSGELPSYRIGRKLLFALRDVEAYFQGRRMGGFDADSGAASPSSVGLASPPQGQAFVVGGSGTAADLVAERLNASEVPTVRANLRSYDALVSMYEGQVQAALVHLFDQRTNAYNVPYVQRLVPGVPVMVFRMVRRWQGLVVAQGNPKAIGSWGALLREGVRLANRARGCGSRILLDEKLLAMEARPEAVSGYGKGYPSGLLAAQAVAASIADVTVAAQPVAATVPGTDFVPLQQEWLDLVVSKEAACVDLAGRLRKMLADEGFRAEYARITQGDPSSLGAIVYDC